jgi:hypothetical protein
VHCCRAAAVLLLLLPYCAAAVLLLPSCRPAAAAAVLRCSPSWPQPSEVGQTGFSFFFPFFFLFFRSINLMTVELTKMLYIARIRPDDRTSLQESCMPTHHSRRQQCEDLLPKMCIDSCDIYLNERNLVEDFLSRLLFTN